MRYRRMPIEIESPEQLGYDTITNNLSESSVADRRLRDLGDRRRPSTTSLLCYGDHLGDPQLREAVAAQGDGLHADDVLVTPGAAAALFATATSQLEPGDHAVVVRTNYATNLETPRAIGADLDVVDLAFDDGWRLDVERLASRVRPGATKLISVTCPHNPTGTMLRARATARAGGARRSAPARCCSSTRRTATSRTATPLPMAATLSPRAISVSSMSKAYGLPGLRVGWAVCRDPAARGDAAGGEGTDGDLRRDDRRSDRGARARRSGAHPAADPRPTCAPGSAIVRDWIAAQDTFEWIEPAGGVVGLVRFAPNVERRHRALLRAAARRARHLRRARPLVRSERPPLPPRLRLADRTGAARGARSVVGDRGHAVTVNGRIMSLSSCSTMWQWYT